jgi:hypothetical protein
MQVKRTHRELRSGQQKEKEMATRSAAANPDVETPSDGEVVDTEQPKAAKAPKAPKRPPLPEGLATPVGLATFISKRDGQELKPQMVYSYLKNAPKDAPFPYVDEANYGPGSFGGRKQVFVLTDGVAWWDAKSERIAGRKAVAAQKKADKEARAASKGAAAPQGEAVEAE